MTCQGKILIKLAYLLEWFTLRLLWSPRANLISLLARVGGSIIHVKVSGNPEVYVEPHSACHTPVFSLTDLYRAVEVSDNPTVGNFSDMSTTDGL